MLRGEMARRVMRDSSTRFDALLSEEVCTFQRCRCSWRERVLHFAIVAIRRATRKTSLKGHTRRVIRLYVTRLRRASSSMLWKCLELSSEGIPYVCRWSVVEWSFSSKRAQEELLLVLFRSVAEYRRCWKHAFNRITRVLSHRRNIVYHIDHKELRYYCIKSYIYINTR